MSKVMKTLSVWAFCHFLLLSSPSHGDEAELFTISIAPDALIALDLSGSMGSPPPGDWLFSNTGEDTGKGYYNCTGDKGYATGTEAPGYALRCAIGDYFCADSEACTGPYYPGITNYYPDPEGDGTSNYTVDCGSRADCTKREIAKKAIYGILDDDKSGNDGKYKSNKIDKKDELSLGVRLGYMRFAKCKNTFSKASDDSGYGGGCSFLRQGFQELNQGTYGYYRTIYEYVEADVLKAQNRTPLGGILSEAKAYLDAHKAGDDAKACRKKFVIFITDGWDTLACGANYYTQISETKAWSYKRRKSTVAWAKAMADAGYKVFIIGFGADMPSTLLNTLNWAAYFGGTDNPDENNYENGVLISGKPTAPLSIPYEADPNNYVAATGWACGEDPACESFNPIPNCDTLGQQLGEASCCARPDDPGNWYPDCCNLAANDPGFKNLSGYAFIATNAAALNAALRRAMETVKAARYSFTAASVSASRVTAGNFLYEASFIPFVDSDPFWQGHLKKYRIDDSGGVVKPADLDAGDVLRDRAAARNMYTYLGGTIRAFNPTNITPSLLGLSSDDTAGRDKVVGYFRGESATYTQEQWRLGDIFHSNPVTIDPPSIFYNDTRSWSAFNSFREANKSREWLMVLGANDGQIHAFSTGDLAEKWSFIPPNLLPKLKLISHATEPASTSMKHQFYVDGPVTVADVWLGSGDGTSKTAGDWKTLMVVGLGRGVRESDSDDDPEYLWSSSSSCDSGFRRKYYSTHPYYCGYWAFDVTHTAATTPTFKWRLNATSNSLDDPKYLDEPWSKMIVGRVKIGGNEKWVGLIGGGYNVHTEYEDDDIETKWRRGKGFFVVDLSNGNILWSYTQKNNIAMDYPVPAAAKVLDWDNDGFIDTAYIADLGGNIWRFRFCSLADGPSCNTANWKGSRLFDSTGLVRATFTTPSVAMDAGAQLWVLWGTGNKMLPMDTGGQDRFFAVKDKDFVSTVKVGNLEKLTTTAYQGTLSGWYMELPSSGEKMLFDSTVFGGMALFTTYTPTSGADPCAKSGIGKLYALAMMPIVIGGVTYNAGAGLMSKPADLASKDGGNKSITLGKGMPTAPLVSQKPIVDKNKPGMTDIFTTVSGGGGSDTVVNSVSDLFPPPEPGKPCPPGTLPALCRLLQTPPQAQIIHWKDLRLQ